MRHWNRLSNKLSGGFTLVELVSVLVLLSILSVYVGPKVFDRSEIAATVYQNRAISILRNMQTRAMQDTRNDGYCYKVYFDTTNEEFGIPSNDFSVTNDQDQINATCADSIDKSDDAQFFYVPSSALLADDINLEVKANNGTDISSITFDTLGRANQTNLSCDGDSSNGYDGCRIAFIGDSTAYVCVESEGYIYAC